MTTELIDLIQTVSLKAIELLGPPAIAAYATYRAATSQFSAKLKELLESHQFQARDRMFSYFQDRIAKQDKKIEELTADLSSVLGFIAGAQGDAIELHDAKLIDLIYSRAAVAVRLLPLEARAIQEEMRWAGLESTAEYQALGQQAALAAPDAPATTYAEVKSILLRLVEAYGVHGICSRLLAQRQMEKVFATYIVPRRLR